jgi:dTDP-4-amino-4,6-dideoxygalactose transaminase
MESMKNSKFTIESIKLDKTNENRRILEDVKYSILKDKINKSNKKRIFLSSPHMGGEEMKYIQESFDTNWIAPMGPNVENFEKEVANYVGVMRGLALNSGTSAIHMALKLLNVKSDDLVFCSSLTFVASCNPVIYEKAIPVFIDSEPQSFNMSPKALKKAFEYYEEKNMKPKVVIVVHIYGQSADMDRIVEICNMYNVPIVEDAAESLGATYKGKETGTMGEFGVFSFNGNKIITTSGGGMLVSNNIKAIDKARFWATQSRDNARYYQHSELGYNYRMSNVLAGIGRGQLKILNERIAKKKSIFEFYERGFIDIPYIYMEESCEYGTSNYWLSVMTLSKGCKIKPIDIIKALEKENVEARHIWKPIHLQPYYEEFKFFSHNDVGISVCEDIFERGICLPSDTKMSTEDQQRVIDVVKELF